MTATKADLAELEARLRALIVTEEKVASIVEDAVSALRVTGPGVTGSAKSGWAINNTPRTATWTITCNDDGTMTGTITIS